MAGRRRIGVLLAEDDVEVREALAALITMEPGMKLVAAVADADEAVEQAAARRPDVAIVDVRMPGGGGAQAAREIKRRSPETKVMALSALADRSTVLEMLEAGVVGYLVKGGSIESIVESIERVADGGLSLSIEVTGDVIGELVEQLSVRRRRDEELQQRRARIRRAIDEDGALRVVLQPICALERRAPVGFEALARFRGPPRRSPDRWFAEAADVGLRRELELAAAERALALLADLPEPAFLSINVSPAVLATPALRRLLARLPSERVVVEITEHAPIEDYERLRTGLGPLRELGIRLAIDDAGAGFASLKHILELAPDFIKLDRSLVAGIEKHRSQQALAAGLISFSDKIGATIVAEGIERAQELETLLTLGVHFGQGYALGRPAARPRAAVVSS